MEIRENIIVPLGYGKFVRSDKIVALEPIEDERGPGRRTRVFIEQLPGPIIASRTENSILESIAEVPREVVEAAAAFELLRDLLDDFEEIGPMLRDSIKRETDLDIDKIEKRIKEILDHRVDSDA